jgi:death-on-curing protein
LKWNVRFQNSEIVQEVIAINLAMIQRYSPGEQVGVKDAGLLESAVSQNHSFHNANKRTAFTALVIFLRLNGLSFEIERTIAHA